MGKFEGIMTFIVFSILIIILYIKDYFKKQNDKFKEKRELLITINALQRFDQKFESFIYDNYSFKSKHPSVEKIIMGFKFYCDPKNTKKIENEIKRLVDLYTNKPEIQDNLYKIIKNYKDSIFQEHRRKIIRTREATGRILDMYKYALIIKEIFSVADINLVPNFFRKEEDIESSRYSARIPIDDFVKQFSNKLKITNSEGKEIVQDLLMSYEPMIYDYENRVCLNNCWFMPTKSGYEEIKRITNKELPESVLDHYIGLK